MTGGGPARRYEDKLGWKLAMSPELAGDARRQAEACGDRSVTARWRERAKGGARWLVRLAVQAAAPR